MPKSLHTVADLYALKSAGQRVIVGYDGPYDKKVIYEFTPEQIAPLFNFAERELRKRGFNAHG